MGRPFTPLVSFRILDKSFARQENLAYLLKRRAGAALGGEEQAIAGWQIKRDGTLRGIIEIVEEQR